MRNYSDKNVYKIAESGTVHALFNYLGNILVIEEFVLNSEALRSSGEEVGNYIRAVRCGNGIDDLINIVPAVHVDIGGENRAAEADVE